MSNPIKETLKKYYNEMVIARKYCKNIMKVLEEDNFFVKAEVGILIQELPEFTFLKHQANFLKGHLRKVCTGEISTEDAYEIVKYVYTQIDEAIALINESKF